MALDERARRPVRSIRRAGEGPGRCERGREDSCPDHGATSRDMTFGNPRDLWPPGLIN